MGKGLQAGQVLEICKDAAIATSIGCMLVAGAAYVSANNAIQTAREAAHDAIDLLEDEVMRNITARAPTLGTVAIAGLSPPTDDVPVSPSLDLPKDLRAAIRDVREAKVAWAGAATWPPVRANFKALDQQLNEGYAHLNLTVHSNLASLLPDFWDLGVQAPTKSVGMAAASAAIGVLAAILDGLSKRHSS